MIRHVCTPWKNSSWCHSVVDNSFLSSMVWIETVCAFFLQAKPSNNNGCLFSCLSMSCYFCAAESMPLLIMPIALWLLKNLCHLPHYLYVLGVKGGSYFLRVHKIKWRHLLLQSHKNLKEVAMTQKHNPSSKCIINFPIPLFQCLNGKTTSRLIIITKYLPYFVFVVINISL